MRKHVPRTLAMPVRHFPYYKLCLPSNVSEVKRANGWSTHRPQYSQALMYILEKSATAASRASAAAGSTFCLAFIAQIITAWWALRASTYAASSEKGDLGSLGGFTRW